MTHTSGPYIATVPPSSAHRFRYIEAVREDENIVVAEIRGLTPGQGETRTALANANLFAAAPDMLAALTFIRDFMGNVDHSSGGGENAARLYGGMLMSIKEVAGTAIAKAGGGA